MTARKYVPPSGAGQVILLFRLVGAVGSKVVRLLFASVVIVLCATPAQAQMYYPGSVWTSSGTYEPVEDGNFLSLTHAEQGVAWKGAELYTHLTLQTDSRGYEWRRAVTDGVGIRFTQSLPFGMVRAGLSYNHTARKNLRTGNIGLFVESWFGWRQQPPMTAPISIPLPHPAP